MVPVRLQVKMRAEQTAQAVGAAPQREPPGLAPALPWCQDDGIEDTGERGDVLCETALVTVSPHGEQSRVSSVPPPTRTYTQV